MISGWSGRIRTCDPCVPNAVLYRAEPHSDKNAAYSLGFRPPQEAELRTPNPVNVALTTQILPASEAAVAQAARSLREGGLVAFPTETVYGLGADAALSGQGPACVQPADCLCRRSQGRGTDCQPQCAGDRARRSVLAGAADAGAAQDEGLQRGRSRHRRARYHRDPGAGARDST